MPGFESHRRSLPVEPRRFKLSDSIPHIMRDPPDLAGTEIEHDPESDRGYLTQPEADHHQEGIRGWGTNVGKQGLESDFSYTQPSRSHGNCRTQKPERYRDKIRPQRRDLLRHCPVGDRSPGS